MSRFFKRITLLSILLFTNNSMQGMLIRFKKYINPTKQNFSLKQYTVKTTHKEKKFTLQQIDDTIAGILDLNNPSRREKAVRFITILIENGYAFESATQIAKNLSQDANYSLDTRHDHSPFNQCHWARHIFKALFKKGQGFKVAEYTAEKLSNDNNWKKKRYALQLFSDLVHYNQAIKSSTTAAEKNIWDPEILIRRYSAHVLADLVYMNHACDIAKSLAMKLCQDKDNKIHASGVSILKALLDRNLALEETEDIIINKYLNSHDTRRLLGYLILSEKRLENSKN